MSLIHKTAIIDDGAILGNNVKVGAFVCIGANVVIGDNTTIAPHTVIEGDTTIGKNNKIFSHCAIGTIPQDLKYNGEDTKLVIGDNNSIREFSLINTGTQGGGGITKIGDNNLFMGYAHIGHDVIMGNNCVLANCATLAGHVELGNNVVIGGLTPIHQFVHIGDFVMIAGASAVTQDIPPYSLAQGNRAHLRGLNLNGLRRHFDKADINALKISYRKIFESGNPIQESVNEILSDTTNEYVINMCQFIKNSKRGIPFMRKKDNEDSK